MRLGHIDDGPSDVTGEQLDETTMAGVKRFTLSRWSRKMVGMFVLARKLSRSLFVSSSSSIFVWSCPLTVVSSSLRD